MRADLFEDDAIQHLLTYKPWWVQVEQEASGKSPNSQDPRVTFTEKEKEQLRKFTNRSYLLEKEAERPAYLGLIDLLLAYCYEVRVTEGERNVESAWNVRKLSGTLCWFENYRSVADVLVSFGRRVLCYPLYRNFCLVTGAVQDACAVLRIGKAAILKCLLDVHSIFQENDPAYILNDLYITDYCIWIQRVKSKKLSGLLDCLQATSISKADLGLELEELEEAATLVQEEEKLLEASDHVPRQPAALITSEASSGSDSSETESTSSDEEDESGSEEMELRDPSATLRGEPAAPLIQVIENAESHQDTAADTGSQPGLTSAPLQAPMCTEEAITTLESPIWHHHAAPAIPDKSQDQSAADSTAQRHVPGNQTAQHTREILEETPRMMDRLHIVGEPAEDEAEDKRLSAE
ncbi:protein SHQ1 homolog [Anomaloglossus baeobatrachus]|uniref:protein SHQ1 homolog n=1 Tax=Anomaloglossus baeobatrachus TaxID=238106 RepID=UPI003F4FB232